MRLARAILLPAVVLGALSHARADRVRVATYNVHDVRAADVADGSNARLRSLALVIQTIRPDVLFLNEIETNPEKPRENAERFAEHYLAVPQGEGLPALRYRVYAAPVNTGVHSGFDLDCDGQADPRAEGRKFGGDCLGYGEFPGQYGMALLVREGLTIDLDRVRTFRGFLWKDMPGALLPTTGPDSTEAWYSDEALDVFPLSSKSHWDVPVVLEDGGVLHVLCSHPTPPVFDGPEDRNGNRNHDEIRFWREYLWRASWIRDDAGRTGALAPDAHAVIVGDLNADPHAGDSLHDPIGSWLLDCPRVSTAEPPRSATPVERLDDTDTSSFRLRVDYVLPTAGVRVIASGVWRSNADNPPGVGAAPNLPEKPPSDHFPVWADLDVPAPRPSR